MAKIKYTGAGATVEVDVDGVPTWTAVGCTTSITAPPQVLTDIETTCQQDTAATAEPGVEQLSQAEFVEPLDYAFSKTILDDLYDARSTHDWRLTFAKGTDTQVIQFPGYISGLVPNAAGGTDPLTRNVTITRTGPITYNPGP